MLEWKPRWAKCLCCKQWHNQHSTVVAVVPRNCWCPIVAGVASKSRTATNSVKCRIGNFTRKVIYDLCVLWLLLIVWFSWSEGGLTFYILFLFVGVFVVVCAGAIAKKKKKSKK